MNPRRAGQRKIRFSVTEFIIQGRLRGKDQRAAGFDPSYKRKALFLAEAGLTDQHKHLVFPQPIIQFQVAVEQYVELPISFQQHVRPAHGVEPEKISRRIGKARLVRQKKPGVGQAAGVLVRHGVFPPYEFTDIGKFLRLGQFPGGVPNRMFSQLAECPGVIHAFLRRLFAVEAPDGNVVVIGVGQPHLEFPQPRPPVVQAVGDHHLPADEGTVPAGVIGQVVASGYEGGIRIIAAIGQAGEIRLDFPQGSHDVHLGGGREAASPANKIAMSGIGEAVLGVHPEPHILTGGFFIVLPAMLAAAGVGARERDFVQHVSVDVGDGLKVFKILNMIRDEIRMVHAHPLVFFPGPNVLLLPVQVF